MSIHLPSLAHRHLAALRMLLVFTVLTGIGYPLLITGIGQLLFPGQADGSLIRQHGKVVASSLIGQNFTAGGKGGAKPDPTWFQPRPSAAGDGYDPTASGASNLGPNDPALVASVKERKAQIAAFNGVPRSQVPADAVTASGSGLDPDISPAYAYLQVDRVAKARGLSAATVHQLVADHVADRVLGFLGEPRVNVVRLNLALAELT
jgi:potassium-transporting ATPase KdpC subunit